MPCARERGLVYSARIRNWIQASKSHIVRKLPFMSFNFAVMLILAYGLGSIPFGYVIVKILTGSDVRQVGSGAIGATNVTRKAGLKAGLVTYLLDVLKGVLAVYLTGIVTRHNLPVMGAAGFLVILGHVFPVFLGFRGGKGVATGVGVFLVLSPLATVTVLGIWIGIFVWTRLVSLGSVLATAALPVVMWLYEGVLLVRSPQEWPQKLPWAVAIAGLIIAKHHENIRRLLNGTEPPFRKNHKS